jgi:hypothetical protein
MPSGTFETGLYAYLHQQGQEKDFIRQRENFYRTEFVNGNWEAVGRQMIGGLLYEHEIIPSWKWDFFDRMFGSLKLGGDEYDDVRIRQIKKPVSSQPAEVNTAPT